MSKNFFSYWIELLFPKNVVHFGDCLQMRWNVKGVNNIVLNAKIFLTFQYKNARKTSFKKYYTMDLLPLLQKQSCKRSCWYVLFENQNCQMPCWKKGKTGLKKESTGLNMWRSGVKEKLLKQFMIARSLSGKRLRFTCFPWNH